jgi:hypothetical protein
MTLNTAAASSGCTRIRIRHRSEENRHLFLLDIAGKGTQIAAKFLDCIGLVVDNVRSPGPYTYAPNLVCEGKLRPWKYANRNAPIIWSAEASCTRVKLLGR